MKFLEQGLNTSFPIKRLFITLIGKNLKGFGIFWQSFENGIKVQFREKKIFHWLLWKMWIGERYFQYFGVWYLYLLLLRKPIQKFYKKDCFDLQLQCRHSPEDARRGRWRWARCRPPWSTPQSWTSTNGSWKRPEGEK